MAGGAGGAGQSWTEERRAVTEKSDGSGELRNAVLGTRNLTQGLPIHHNQRIPPSIAALAHPRIPPASSPALSSSCCPARLPVGLRSGLSASRPPAIPNVAASLPRHQDPSSMNRVRQRVSSTPAETLPALPRRLPWSPKQEPASRRCLV